LVASLVVVLLAGCDSKVAPSGSPQTQPSVPAPSATARPVHTPASIPTITPTLPPTSLDLPAPFDAIAWAHMPFSADANEYIVTFGVLGKQATGSRTYSQEPYPATSGSAVLIQSDASTEIIDARTGATIGTFEQDALRLPLDGIDPNDLTYLQAQKFVADVGHGFLYDMSANRSGVQLRRFDLDGKHPTVLVTLAPDPGKDFWDHVDFVVADDGTIVATACPEDRSKVSDHRCRLYVIPTGAAGPAKPRYLPSSSARPCFLLVADAQFLMGSPYVGCHADGGYPELIPYMKLDLTTLRSVVKDAPSDLTAYGMEYEGNDVGPLPDLVANLSPRPAYASPYEAIGVLLRFEDYFTTLDRYVPLQAANENEPDPYAGYVWAIEGRGDGWTLLRGFGPEYVLCRVDQRSEFPAPCSSGPEILETSAGSFELPKDTWGRFVEP
jgi:hypothetical protein